MRINRGGHKAAPHIERSLTMTKANFIGDDSLCKCGNPPHGSGFQACLRSGEDVEPTNEAWTDGCLLRCIQCGAIVEWDTGDIVGRIIGSALPEVIDQTLP
jgi:hypothetical protein